MTKIPNSYCSQGEGCYCLQGVSRKLVSSGTTALDCVLVIGAWCLGFICYLVLVIWNF